MVVPVERFHTRPAIEGACSVVGPETMVVSIQNGMGHEASLSGVVGRERVLAGKTHVGGVLLGPGHVRAGVAGK